MKLPMPPKDDDHQNSPSRPHISTSMNKGMMKAAGSVSLSGPGRPGAGGKLEMGSIKGAVKLLNSLKKGEPYCG